MAGLFGAGKGAGAADLEVEFGECGSVVGVDHRFHAGDGVVIAAVGDEPALVGCRPRPTRPQIWWSCARPNLLALRTTMTRAFGTLTPTSMTVVTTSTSMSPRLNASITVVRSSGFCLPWVARRAGQR